MYKVDFSLTKWNFTVYFNQEKDYLVYKDKIENSIYEMYHKKNYIDKINIYYINDEEIYNKLYQDLNKYNKETIPSFKDEYYDKYGNIFVNRGENYLIYREGNNYNIITKEYINRPELVYLIREIYVRLEENDNGIFMHGNGIKVGNDGLILAGNSGSGKTTFMFKLFENNPNKLEYLSNDRVFIKENNEMEYFPIPLILATGTARNIESIYSYLIKKNSLYESSYSKEILLKGNNETKFELYKKYIPKIYPNCKLKESETIDNIIIPKINFNTRKLIIEKETNIDNILATCFTPIDYESLRKPWILDRDKGDIELLNHSKELLMKQLKNSNIYKVEYNPQLESQYIQEEVKRKILKRR